MGQLLTHTATFSISPFCLCLPVQFSMQPAQARWAIWVGCSKKCPGCLGSIGEGLFLFRVSLCLMALSVKQSPLVPPVVHRTKQQFCSCSLPLPVRGPVVA